ncbi:hypothetical protein [Peribacillus sp. NPDC056705]|uniref:hypothetical protein n=1 Tax=Peribacillus sp. NPDC056705 TaxID=3345918 RepID=UPI00374A3302
MQLRKVFSVLLIFACLLSFSQSAFADNSEGEEASIEVQSIGSNRENPIEIQNLYYSTGGLLISEDDEKWYKWTNDTGSPKLLYSDMYPDFGQTSLSLSAILQYNETVESNFIYANKDEDRSIFNNLYIPNGTTVYLRIKMEDSTPPYSYYRLHFLILNGPSQ